MPNKYGSLASTGHIAVHPIEQLDPRGKILRVSSVQAIVEAVFLKRMGLLVAKPSPCISYGTEPVLCNHLKEKTV